jgi:hypothetical protein
MPEFESEAMTKLLADELVLQKAATEAAAAAAEATAAAATTKAEQTAAATAAAATTKAAKKAEQTAAATAATVAAADQHRADTKKAEKKKKDAYCAEQQKKQVLIAASKACKAEKAATSIAIANSIVQKLKIDRNEAPHYKTLTDPSELKLPDGTWQPWLSACHQRTLKDICKRSNLSLADETILLQEHADRVKSVSAARSKISAAVSE